ncbi:MAG: N-acetylglucosamine-6-phosphate deacetylase [Lachnospiraceae bacterium]|nr:N-acetylglucosamine-6-phosphate deacetylase [Lachnospiraceae bacterium]
MVLKNASAFIGGKFQSSDIEVTGGKISAVRINNQESGCCFGPVSDDSIGGQIVDCTGKMVWPGLFDIHTHGCLGFDFSKSSPDELLQMCSFYARHGVTSVLATTMTNEGSQCARAMGYIRQAMELQAEAQRSAQGMPQDVTPQQPAQGTVPGVSRIPGAKIRGIHAEGPFFGPAKRGAHDEQYLRPVSQLLVDEYQRLSGHAIRLFDIDPSLPGALDFIRNNREHFTISIAHTDCDYNTAKSAAEAGVSHVTHLFNAMRPFLHREPGVVGAAFECGLNAELICDGIHIHPAVIRLMFAAMPERILLISDSINPTGLTDGHYTAGGLPVEVKGGRAYLADGTLAGSTITLFDAVKNAVRFGIPLEQALSAATCLPARAVGLAAEVGSIACGRAADLLIVGEGFALEQVMLDGRFLPMQETL